MNNPIIRVRAKTTRYSFDGQTGILVFAGTLGTVADLKLAPAPTVDREGLRNFSPSVRIWWDASVVQDKANDEPGTYEGWEDCDVDPKDLEYVEVKEG